MEVDPKDLNHWPTMEDLINREEMEREKREKRQQKAGRPKRGYDEAMDVINYSNKQTRKDRWLDQSNKKVILQFEIALATRLEQYAKAGIISKVLTGHPQARKLWRIYKAYKGNRLHFQEVDIVFDLFLREAKFFPVQEMKDKIKNYEIY